MSFADRFRTAPKFLAGRFAVCLTLLSGTPVVWGGEVIPDFSLMDVNATSSTYDQLVSPRDYMGQASGWYFGSAN